MTGQRKGNQLVHFKLIIKMDVVAGKGSGGVGSKQGSVIWWITAPPGAAEALGKVVWWEVRLLTCAVMVLWLVLRQGTEGAAGGDVGEAVCY